MARSEEDFGKNGLPHDRFAIWAKLEAQVSGSRKDLRSWGETAEAGRQVGLNPVISSRCEVNYFAFGGVQLDAHSFVSRSEVPNKFWVGGQSVLGTHGSVISEAGDAAVVAVKEGIKTAKNGIKKDSPKCT